MSISIGTSSFVSKGGNSVALSSMFSVTPATSNPTYLVLTGLDRNEYTAGASGATGVLSGNGNTDVFSSIGGDGRAVGLVFSYQTASGRYYNNTYGYLDQMSYKVSTSNNDLASFSLYGTSSLNLANSYSNNVNALAQLDASGYLGSVTVATQPNFTASVPTQATPNSICSIAQSFVGKAWNMNGCWVLASTIAAEAGASLPVDSTLVGLSGQSNGEWLVAFNGATQSGNWQAMVKAGEIIVIGGSASAGHITTCVSGSGSSAMLVDNVAYVNASGAVMNLANDGSSKDIIIAAAHAASREWTGVQSSLVKIYELDTPSVSSLVSSDRIAFNGSQTLSQLFTASDPAGKAITGYQVYDSAATDSFSVNGTVASAHSANAAISVSSLSAACLVAGASVCTDTLEVRAFNGSYWGDWQGLSVSVAASVAAAPPTVTSQTAAQTWTQGQQIKLTLPANTFTDPQGQSLTYAATQANGLALPGWLAFNAATESFSGTVPSGAQSLSLKVTATDASGLSVAEVFSANIAAPAAVVTSATPSASHQTPNQTWRDGQKVSLAISPSDFTGGQTQHLAYSAFQLAGPSVSSWLRFHPANDIISGTVPSSASGTLTLEVIAFNANGTLGSDTFNVTLAHATAAVELVGVMAISAVQAMELIPF